MFYIPKAFSDYGHGVYTHWQKGQRGHGVIDEEIK